MSFNENDYSVAHLLGNTDVPRNLLPTLRATKRRLDPDGTSTVPYYAGVSGKGLKINYTKEVLGVVTPASIDLTLTSNSLAAIISDINAGDASNVEALDQDGFLVIRNKNPGKTHYIQIDANPSVSTAAALLGFREDPFPGSISYAGEIASAPGIRTEENPQGTTLIGGGEDLLPGTLNRPHAQLLQLLQDIRNELEKDVLVYREIEVTFGLHPISNSFASVELNDSDLRVPIEMMGMAGNTVAQPNGILDPFFTILLDDGSNEEMSQNTSGEINNLNIGPVTANGAFYATNATAFDDTASFSTWGTPDGKTIYGPTVPNKDKHASVAITSFDGSIAYCAGATFVTKYVKKGDPVQISSPVSTDPFDHSGWFAVDKVIDETHLALRPMAASERAPAGGNRPRTINPAGLGNLRVAVGYFIPAVHLWIQANFATDTPPARIRVACAVPAREALAEDFAFGRTGNWQILASLVENHLSGPNDRHAASQISSFDPGITWANGDTVSGANLAAMITDLITDLRSSATPGGTNRIGAAAQSIGGSSPNSLSAGPLFAQITSLLTLIQTATNYGGSSPNAFGDGSTLAAATFESALDSLVAKLGATTITDDGAKKIGAQNNGDLALGTVRSQLDQLDTEWGRLARTNTWTQAQTLNGTSTGDPNVNPVLITTQLATVAKLLWKISLNDGGVELVRLYAYNGSIGNGFAITVNAEYSVAAGWTADNPGGGAIILLLTDDRISLSAKTSTASPWGDATWLTERTLTAAGVLTAVSASLTSATIGGTSINGSGKITVAANQDVVVSGTGSFKHGDMILVLPSSVAEHNEGGAQQWTYFGSIAGAAAVWGTPSGSGADVIFPIPLKVGDRIKQVKAWIKDDNTVGHTVSMYFHRSSSSDFVTGGAQIGSTQTSAHDGTVQALTLSGLTTTLAAGDAYEVLLRGNASGTMQIMSVEITYDRP